MFDDKIQILCVMFKSGEFPMFHGDKSTIIDGLNICLSLKSGEHLHIDA